MERNTMEQIEQWVATYHPTTCVVDYSSGTVMITLLGARMRRLPEITVGQLNYLYALQKLPEMVVYHLSQAGVLEKSIGA
jgi:hypothetical protein